jgi:hypoxanthine phosphoribosyltransferase
VSASPTVLISEQDIAKRVAELARAIAPKKPEIAIPILVGGFIFAADLVRALAREGAQLETEFLWLRSYGNARSGGSAISLLAGPSENVHGKNVLLVDGVLDVGRTIVKAQQLLQAAGAKSITTVVIVDKGRSDAIARADFAGFTNVNEFIVGYGMDDAGKFRGLPYIGKAQ